MCGIIGAAAATPLPESAPPSRAREALQSHRHRGPDHQSEYRDGRIWLGHTRLSILDLSPAGNQPMQSPDGRYVISYNGEVFNYRELAGEFGLDDLRSRSDTEVVLRLFARLGAGSFAKLNGQFAFAIYDRAAQKLCLARDRLGIKPLYYRFTRQGLAFASEIKGLVALTDDPLTCDLASLNEWLHYGNALGERTLYEGVRQLLPGHYLELDLRSLSHVVHAYWSIGEQAKAVLPTTERREIIDSTRRLLEQAVRRQLVSDVPVGVFLSGGIDSSAIAAFASRHYGGRLATYSAGFDFAADGSELPKARRVAALYGTDHHEIHVGGEDVGDLVEKMVHHHDAPFGDAANIPLYLMAARISAETKVVLQGDGGDELFGGYRRYATLRYYRLLSPLARLLQRADGMLPDSALGHRIQRYVHALAAGNLTATIALLLTSEDRDQSPAAVFSPSVGQAVRASDAFARFRELHARFAGQDIGNQMSLMDLSIILPDIYLEKVDRSTMAAGLEVRVPFLDHDLVDYVVRLPGEAKMPRGRRKWLLKEALRDIVPEDVLSGPKRGFSVPFGSWLQTSLKPLFFDHLDRFARARPGILDVEHVRRLHARTSSGRQDHSPLLWRVLNFLIWSNNSNVDFRVQDAR